jgi:DNA-binding response OmpR family regulator
MHEMEDKPKVLLVDDEPGILRILTIQLKHSDLETISTTSGAEAVELARTKNPDAVLLDVLMPGMSGLEVLQRIREFSKVPVIIFTANPKIIEIANQMGVSDCVAKPYDPDRLVEKIQSVIVKSKKETKQETTD